MLPYRAKPSLRPSGSMQESEAAVACSYGNDVLVAMEVMGGALIGLDVRVSRLYQCLTCGNIDDFPSDPDLLLCLSVMSPYRELGEIPIRGNRQGS